MRPLRLALWWAAAAWVAFTVVVRIARGEVVLLSSHAAPVVRLVAVIVVFLLGCAERLRPEEQRPEGAGRAAGSGSPGDEQGSPGDEQGAPGDEQGAPAATVHVRAQGGEAQPLTTVEPTDAVVQEFPPRLTDAALTTMYDWIGPRGLWRRVVDPHAAEDMPRSAPIGARGPAAEELAAQVRAHQERRKKGEAETAATLTALLSAAEAVPLYDAWLAGFVWLQARGLRPAPTDLLARVERHLRVTHALVLAQAVTGRVEFSAWRSKAAPPAGWRGASLVPPGLAAAARRAFDGGADAAQFESTAVLALSVTQGAVTLVRRAGATTLTAGTAVRLRRLDVLRAPAGATLRHAQLGPLVLPAGAEVTAWNVGEFVGAEGRAYVGALIDAALAGDPVALTGLEAVLPAAHAAIREATRARPDAPGAASLRTLLTAFDE
jgi:hypothetical protein